MGFIELFLIAVGLSMDAFAVSVCKGLSVKKVGVKHAALAGLYFGGFQFLMPVIGYLLGFRFESVIETVDHWVAFVLLAFIGGKMIAEARKPEEEETPIEMDQPLDLKELLVMAVATSIDALAVGISFAFLNYPLVEAVTVIGVTTFFISVAGVYIGNYFGNKYQKKAEMAGGVILILIGTKILLEHLGILG